MTMKIKWNLEAFEEVRKSAEVEDVLQGIVDALVETAGEDLYKGSVTKGKDRSRGTVWTAGTHAIRSNAKHNTLVRALGSVHVGDQ